METFLISLDMANLTSWRTAISSYTRAVTALTGSGLRGPRVRRRRNCSGREHRHSSPG